MKYLLCVNFDRKADADMISRWIDRLDVPFEWMDLPSVSDVKLLVIRCESAEEIEERMRTFVDRNIMTAFGFWQPERVEVFDGV